jgi:ankyrin repeat protein
MGFSHLEVAATCSNSTIVKALCDYGQFVINPAKFMNDSLSLSHFAASVNNTEVIEVLVDNGYCHESKDIFGRTPLMYSCIYGHKETIKYLIDAGCNVNVRANNGISAVGCAIERKHKEIVMMLIGAGAVVEDEHFLS